MRMPMHPEDRRDLLFEGLIEGRGPAGIESPAFEVSFGGGDERSNVSGHDDLMLRELFLQLTPNFFENRFEFDLRGIRKAWKSDFLSMLEVERNRASQAPHSQSFFKQEGLSVDIRLFRVIEANNWVVVARKVEDFLRIDLQGGANELDLFSDLLQVLRVERLIPRLGFADVEKISRDEDGIEFSTFHRL